MPDAFTTYIGLVKPEVGASRDSWGSKTNANWDVVDQLVFMATPIGAILDFAGPTPPTGWLVADGRAVSRTTYSHLFAVLGSTWGAGDGVSTFNLPNLNGRSAVGPGTVTDAHGTALAFTFGQVTGWLSNPITQANLPNYALTTTVAGGHSHAGATLAAGPWGVVTDAQGTHSHTGQTTGNNVDHTHTGFTDFQGEHTHQYAAVMPGGSGVGSGSGYSNQVAQTATSNGGAANHQHNVQTYGASTIHVHFIAADGNHAHNVTVPGHTHGIYYDGDHQHTTYLNGGGSWLGLLNPVLVVTKIIYAGQDAATAALAAVAAPSAMSLAADASVEDELAAMREEIASLRAILAPVAAQRLLSSPLRGTN